MFEEAGESLGTDRCAPTLSRNTIINPQQSGLRIALYRLVYVFFVYTSASVCEVLGLVIWLFSKQKVISIGQDVINWLMQEP